MNVVATISFADLTRCWTALHDNQDDVVKSFGPLTTAFMDSDLQTLKSYPSFAYLTLVEGQSVIIPPGHVNPLSCLFIHHTFGAHHSEHLDMLCASNHLLVVVN